MRLRYLERVRRIDDRAPSPAMEPPASAFHAPQVRIARSAGELMRPVPPATAATTNDVVRELFVEHPDLNLVAVLDCERPVGIIQRHAFMETYARPFTRDLYGKKSCTALMRPAPLVVDAEMPVGELARLAVVGGSQVLEDGFVVTREGRYAGVGQGPALVAALSALEAQRAQQIEESVRYASTIQRAMLANATALIARALPDSALLWEPRDLVGGDCYGFRELPSGLAGAVIDCTGHGVPGAFMTCIAYTALEAALSDPRVAASPALVLGHLDRAIKATLRHGAPGEAANDGLDAFVFHLARDRKELRIASARVAGFVRTGHEVQILPAARVSVGHAQTPDEQVWPTLVVALEPSSLVAITTDGFTDQIGGPRRIAFGKRRLAELLASTAGTGAITTAEAFRCAHAAWQADEPRRDDATFLAFTTGGLA